MNALCVPQTGWDRLHVATPPVGDVVTLIQAKKHLRIDHSDDDDLIQAYVAAAQGAIEGPTGIGVLLLDQDWEIYLDNWPKVIEIPLGPITDVSAITYTDQDGATQTLSSSLYVVDVFSSSANITRAYGATWPTARTERNSIKVAFSGGFGDFDDVPRDLKQAMLLMVSHYYEHREAVVGVENRDSSTELPLGVSAILDRYRRGIVA